MLVEFIGINGSGKTTLHRKANEYMAHKLGYKPGPETGPWRMHHDQSLIRHGKPNSQLLDVVLKLIPPKTRSRLTRCIAGHFNYEALKDFVKNYAEYAGQLILSHAIHGFNEHYDTENKHILIDYALNRAAYYQQVTAREKDRWVMMDEGFYIDMVKYVVDDDGILNTVALDRFISSAPKVDLLFHVDTNVSTALSRKSASGMPLGLRNLGHTEAHQFLLRFDRNIRIFVESIKRYDTRIVSVDNCQSEEKAFDQVAAALDGLWQSVQEQGPMNRIQYERNH